MTFLTNINWEFIITTGISILSIGIAIWSLREPAQLHISYEAIEIEPVEDVTKIKELMKASQSSSGNDTVNNLYLLTFKIWNSGRKSIQLPDQSNPLVLLFEEGVKILNWDELQPTPSYVKVTPMIEEEKVMLVLPLLKPKESVSLRLLLNQYVNYFPHIYARIPGKERIVRANNVESSKQLKIVAFLCFVVGIFFFASFSSDLMGNNPMATFYFIGKIGELLAWSILFFLFSIAQRRLAPYPFILPSTYFSIFLKLFLRIIPVLIIMGILAGAIYALFGLRILALLFVMSYCLFGLLASWYMPYTLATYILRKRKKVYNAILVRTLSAMPCVVLLGMCVYIFVDIFQHW